MPHDTHVAIHPSLPWQHVLASGGRSRQLTAMRVPTAAATFAGQGAPAAAVSCEIVRWVESPNDCGRSRTCQRQRQSIKVYGIIITDWRELISYLCGRTLRIDRGRCFAIGGGRTCWSQSTIVRVPQRLRRWGSPVSLRRHSSTLARRIPHGGPAAAGRSPIAQPVRTTEAPCRRIAEHAGNTECRYRSSAGRDQEGCGFDACRDRRSRSGSW